MMRFRVFDTVGQCEAYCRQAYVTMVRARAATATDQELDDWWDLPNKVKIPNIPDAQINGARFPLYGRNADTHEWNRSSGFTTGWVDPRQTADGRWAAECLDPNDPQGQPTPTWPVDPDPIGG